MRVRSCHLTGSFVAKDNRRPPLTVGQAAANPRRDVSRIVLPPANFVHEIEKIEQRWPAALRFVAQQRLNEWFGPDKDEIGIIVQGGLYNTLNRALELVGLSDAYGASRVPVYCLNVTYPLIPDEVKSFCAGKTAVLILEEGQPEFIEHELNTLMRRADLQTRIVGKEIMPRAGEYSGQVLRDGLIAFLRAYAPDRAPADVPPAPPEPELAKTVPGRPAGFCTGCPERPIFAAMKLVQRELGELHVSGDIGCHIFASLPPFHISNTTMGYGLGTAAASAFKPEGKRAVAMMGDGGFWHNGLTSGIGNAVFNQDDTLTIVVDNGYSAATGGQDILSSRARNDMRATNHPIEKAARGLGIAWARTLTHTYDVATMRDTIREALTSPEKGPKLIVAQSECMLNKQRRVKPQLAQAAKEGKRVVRERFGVDPDTCTGDHACIRLSGCPSLSIQPNPDPLRQHPVTAIDNSCVGCGNCGEVAHAAILCPSFYKASIITNPSRWDRAKARMRGAVIGWLQQRHARGLAARAY
jgi:indolepyruvate ferredoxin oxidoreductase alpha subunit